MAKAYSVEQLRLAVSSGYCWSDVCRSLKVSVCTFNINRARQLCLTHNVSHAHFDRKATFRRGKFSWAPEAVFVENSTVTRSDIRRLCIRFGLYSGKCEGCGIINEWNGKPLIIELDHINGVSNDNRRENLRWLCPNCHSQTETYRRKTIPTE